MENIKTNSLKGNDFYVSLAPHIRSKDTVTKIMLDVIIALIPALIGSVYFMGIRALWMTIICVVSCVCAEYIIQRILKKPVQIRDLSAVVTGILIAFNLPIKFPFWMAIFGCFFTMIIVKECFGGIGQNFMNPALAARIVLMASWAKDMTSYIDYNSIASSTVDGVVQATPLQMIKAGTFEGLPPLQDMIIGRCYGVIGETSAILLAIGGIYLIIRGVISWKTPVVFIGTTIVFLFIFGVPANIIPYEVFGGGLFLGAFFMATDYASSPANGKGKLIFAFGCGLITALIRTKASLPEGVSYAICLMNVASPLIDRLTKTQAYGEAKK